MASKVPAFTYTGTYTTMLKNGYWYILFKTSGTLRMTYAKDAQVYIHGGGGAGGRGVNSAGGGGAGGYFKTENISIFADTDYPIVIGAGGSLGWYDQGFVGGDGKASSAFGCSANGGGGGKSGDGAAGGVGGSGNGGQAGSGNGGYGSPAGSNTTYAFNDPACGLIYGGGGGGGAPRYGGIGAKGLPYGAQDGASAGANTGAGGAGGNYADGEAAIGPTGVGGSGIVILRSAQDDELPVTFDGKTLQRMTFNGSEVGKLIFNGTQIFMERVRRWLTWLSDTTKPSAQRVI